MQGDGEERHGHVHRGTFRAGATRDIASIFQPLADSMHEGRAHVEDVHANCLA
jgi:hypothetical protein